MRTELDEHHKRMIKLLSQFSEEQIIFYSNFFSIEDYNPPPSKRNENVILFYQRYVKNIPVKDLVKSYKVSKSQIGIKLVHAWRAIIVRARKGLKIEEGKSINPIDIQTRHLFSCSRMRKCLDYLDKKPDEKLIKKLKNGFLSALAEDIEITEKRKNRFNKDHALQSAKLDYLMSVKDAIQFDKSNS